MMCPVSATDSDETAGPTSRGAIPREAVILVVEDDSGMRILIDRFLRKNGFRAIPARDGREMWEVLEHASVDLVLLDIMLPGTSGFDLCRALRVRSKIPVIILSARGSETDRVLGLELGADDYIAKPFSRPELLARIRAVLRRTAEGPEPAKAPVGRKIGFDDWTLDTGRRELLASDGAVIDLSAAEYDLLLAFIEHPQRVLTRDQLLELSRGRAGEVFDRSVDVLVGRLRRKIEREGDTRPLIKTLRGAGYMFTANPRRF
jgi:two-component system OmpR family response regulator